MVHRRNRIIKIVVLCSAVLALPAWLFGVSVGKAAEPNSAPPGLFSVNKARDTGGEKRVPAEVMTTGIISSIGLALNALEAGSIPAAGLAIDDARRAAELGIHAVSPGAAFRDALELLEASAVRLRMGDFAGVRARLNQVRDQLSRMPGAALMPMGVPHDLSRYAGATVVNALGARIGKVIHISEGARAQIQILVGESDGAPLGGQRLELPPSFLLFGEPRRPGETLVGVPTLFDYCDAGAPT